MIIKLFLYYFRVDYVDCLGRTRRCHKTDLEHTQKQDESLKIKLSGPPPPLIQETSAEKTFVKEGVVSFFSLNISLYK